LDSKGAKLMLSNSDPKNLDKDDLFFDILYNEYNIQRVNANRMINSNGKGRIAITELLIKNY
jgi:DNA adenine methylase